jgi:hypothetical protein
MPLRSEPRFPDVPPKAGHYESFYIKACHPSGGMGIWIRHTVHKRPGAEATASIWFTLFDARAAAPKATKVTVPARDLRSDDDLYIAIGQPGAPDGQGDAMLQDGRAIGRVETEALTASWDLTFADESEPFRFLPRGWMYKTKLPKTKFISPYPSALFTGKLTVDGWNVDLEGWPGMIGHNWGAEHAERWVWIQGAAFADRPRDTYFDAGAARIKVGAATVPWIANGRLVLDGEEHRLGGLERMRSTKIDETPTRCDFVLHGSGVVVRGNVSAEPKDFVGWVYADPGDGEHNTVNCSISNMELLVERSGKPAETLVVRGGAAYELGMRETDHGIPIQPYSDG